MDSKLEKLEKKWNPSIKDPTEDEDEICIAVFKYSGKMTEIKNIIDTFGINGKTIYNYTLLHLACKYKKLNIVKYLMDNGANKYMRDINGRTPLFYTLHHNNTEIVETLKLTKVYIELGDKFGQASIHYAKSFSRVIYNYFLDIPLKDPKLEKLENKWLWNPSIIELIERHDEICIAFLKYSGNMTEIKNIVETFGINGKTIYDYTLLHLACKYKKHDLVKYLMDNGANKYMRDINGRTPLFFTLHHNNLEIVKTLKLYEVYTMSRDKFGVSSIQYSTKGCSVFSLHKDFAQFIFPNVRFSKSQDLFIKYSDEILSRNNIFNEFELIKFAIKNCSIYISEHESNKNFWNDVLTDFVNVKIVDEYGLTMLHKVFNIPDMNDNEWKTVLYLIRLFQKNGSNVNAKTKDIDGLSLSKILINRDMSVDRLQDMFKLFCYNFPRDNFNRTDLQYTIIHNKVEHFDWLVENWPQYFSTDNSGNTCLHLAVQYSEDFNYKKNEWKQSFIIKILSSCEHRLLYVKNLEEETALDIAKKMGMVKIALMFEELMSQDTILNEMEKFCDEDQRGYISYGRFPIDHKSLRGLHSYFVNEKLNLIIQPSGLGIFFQVSNQFKKYKDNIEVIKKFYDENENQCLKRNSWGFTPFTHANIYCKDLYQYLKKKLKTLIGKATYFVLSQECTRFHAEYEVYLELTKQEHLKEMSLEDLICCICKFNNQACTNLFTNIVVNLKSKSELNKKPLQIAVEIYNDSYSDGWLFLVRNLVEKGDDVHVRDEFGKTLLHLASDIKSNENLFRFLLASGIDINIYDSTKNTAINYLINKYEEEDKKVEDVEVLSMLLNHTNLQSVNKNEDNYLHRLVKIFSDDNFIMLLDYLPNVYVEELMKGNKEGKTPLHIAVECGKTVTFDYLQFICNEKIILKRDIYDKTALDYAAENKHIQILWKHILKKKWENSSTNFIEFYIYMNQEYIYDFRVILSTKKDQEGFFKNNLNKYKINELVKLFDEFTTCGVNVEPEIEFKIQKKILDTNLIIKKKEEINQTNIDKNKDIDKDEKKIQAKISFLIKVLEETIEKLSESNIDVVLFQNLLVIVINIRQLKDKLNKSWKQIEFIIVSYLTIYSSKNVKIDLDLFVYKMILNKQRIKMHLKTFLESLIDNKNTKSKIKLTTEKKKDVLISCLSHETAILTNLISSIKENQSDSFDEIKRKINAMKSIIDQSVNVGAPTKDQINHNTTFKELHDDYESIRTVYSLSKILHYVNESVSIDIKNDDLGIFVIQRTMQVFGEYIKNTDMCPNISPKIQNAISSETKYLNNCLITIRNDLSHVDNMQTTLDVEYNLDIYIKIQSDFRHLRSLLISLLCSEREECCRKLLRKMLDSQTENDLNDLCSNFLKENMIDVDPILKISSLIHKLKTDFVFKSQEEQIIFSSIDKILNNINIPEQAPTFNFGNPENFLLNTEDEISLNQTKKLLQYGELQNKSMEPLQPIAFFILQLQKMAEIRLYPSLGEDFKKIQYICNEILSTSLIGLQMKISKRSKYKKTTEFRFELLKSINDEFTKNIGNIQDAKLRAACKAELEEYKSIHEKFNIMKEIDKIPIKTTEQNNELKEIYNELNNKTSTMEVANITNSIELNIDIKKIKNLQKTEDKYFNFIEDCYKDKSVNPIKDFLLNFKCLIDKKNELRKCFNDQIRTLKCLLPEQYCKLQKPNKSLTIAVEMIVLNLYEILGKLEMMVINSDILDNFPPILSTQGMRNYLAHGDALFDILPFKTEISVFANAYKLINFIKESKFNISDEDNIIFYSRHDSSEKSYEMRNKIIHSNQNIISKAVNCNSNPLGSIYYLFLVPILRGVDIHGKTLFNLIFEQNPRAIIHFFMDPSNKIIRSKDYIKCISKQINLINSNFNLNDADSFLKYLVNNIFIANKRHEIIDYLLKICALKGYHNEIDEICSNNYEESDTNTLNDIETSLTKNYRTLMKFSSQYSFVNKLKRYSKELITEYDESFSNYHLAAAFNHIEVIKKLLIVTNQSDPLNVTARNMKTPLHIAAQCGHEQMINFLINEKADIDAKTIDGTTYQDYIKIKKENHFFDYLELKYASRDKSRKNNSYNCKKIPDRISRKSI